MWKHIGFLCYHMWSEFFVNISPSWWRWPMMHPLWPWLPQILISYMMWKFTILCVFHSHVGNCQILSEVCLALWCFLFLTWSSWYPHIVCGPCFGFQWWFFQGFHGLVETNHDNICMKWIIDLHIEIDHLEFEPNG
jgi:hypothetical protein